MSYITLTNVLQIMRLGKKCSLKVCSYNKEKKTGGKRLEYKNVILCQGRAARSGAGSAPAGVLPQTASKNPHHRFNKTINIQTVSGDVVTIHPVLIEEFNGQKIAQ